MVTITTKTATTEEKSFPKLMTHEHVGIVFFTEPKKGLWIKEGVWYEDWDMENYEDYNEAITIKNE